jgi:ferrous iron transport protein A
MRLTDLREGRTATVTGLSADSAIRRRLQDIGFVEGVTVSRAFSSPLGDPVAYMVKGALIALRCEDSSCIFVQTV